jgi:serine phosphatase RsbU (regulator of sigma subunit)
LHRDGRCFVELKGDKSVLTWVRKNEEIPLTPRIEKALQEDFIKADRLLLMLIFVHWFAASTVTAYSYGFYQLGFIGGGVITLLAWLGYYFYTGTRISRIIMGISLMAFSAIFIQQHLGRIEMHFHVFLGLPILMRYRKDIMPVIAAGVATCIHHLVFNYCQVYDIQMFGTPLKVYNYGSGLDITLLHAAFVVISVIIYIILIRESTYNFCHTLHVENENSRMSAEIDVSRRIQRMLLPKPEELKQITCLDIAGFMQSANGVGGDYYDVLTNANGVKIGIGDVTGHGLESGVLMLMVQTAVRTLFANQVNDPKQFFSLLNQVVYKNLQRINSDKNLTLTLLDYQNGKLRFSGQHEEVLVVRKNGEVERIDTVDLGFMVGLEADIEHFVNCLEVELDVGEGVVLYTDGISEAFNPHRVAYGVERLCQVIRAHWHDSARDIKRAIINDVMRHIGSHQQMDDITLLVIKRRSSDASDNHNEELYVCH